MHPMDYQAERAASFLLKKVSQAVWEHTMIADGDRVAVAVSGGWDSLSLLELLDYRRRIVQDDYSLFAIHVIGDSRGPVPELEHKPLMDWLASRGIPYAVVPLELPSKERLPLNCHRCTWNRRKTLFQVAHQHGCNKVAFGHHADDLIETALLNLFHHGSFESMDVCADYFNGTFHLIRPMAHIHKPALRRFAKLMQFPIPPPECPRAATSHRAFATEMMRNAQAWNRKARRNVLAAIRRSQGTVVSNPQADTSAEKTDLEDTNHHDT